METEREQEREEAPLVGFLRDIADRIGGKDGMMVRTAANMLDDLDAEAVEGDGVEPKVVSSQCFRDEGGVLLCAGCRVQIGERHQPGCNLATFQKHDPVECRGAAPQDADAEEDSLQERLPQSDDALAAMLKGHSYETTISALGAEVMREAARRLRRGGGEDRDRWGKWIDAVAKSDSDWYNVATLQRRDNERRERYAVVLHELPEEMSDSEWERTLNLLHRLRDAPSEERPGGSGEPDPDTALKELEFRATEYPIQSHANGYAAYTVGELGDAVRDRLRRSTPDASREELVKIARDHMPATVGFGEHTWDEQAEKIVDEILERLDHPAPDSEADSDE